jgi:protein-tyrosine phosphatase
VSIAAAGRVSFQDVGGHAAGPERAVRRGCVYRIAGALIDGAELAEIAQLGLRSVIDLREPLEDRAALETFAAANGIAYHHIPVAIATLEELVDCSSSLDRARAFVADAYRDLVDRYGTALARAMAALDGPFPVGFGCAAGKDRTGMLSALLQRALGVPLATVVAEYTRCAPDPAVVRARLLTLTPPGYQPGPGFEYVTGVSTDALLGALDRIDERYDDTAAYLVAMGAPPAVIGRLRRRLLEPPRP